MSLRNKVLALLPKRFLWKLTIVHIVVIALAIGVSSWAIYSSACVLVEGIGTVDGKRQGQFNQSLLQYFLIISTITMIGGSVIHHYVTKKMLDPVQQLIEATKKMQQGIYPSTIPYKEDNEIGELIHQYNVMIERIQINEQERDKLITDLSHEIRTPLASLTGYLQALQQGVVQGDTELYESLHQQAKRLMFFMEQIDQLKQWGEKTEGTIAVKEHVSIEKMIQLLVHMFALQLERKGSTITCDVQPYKLLVQEDALQQVLSNVIDNAVSYGVEGKTISIHGWRNNETYTLSIFGESTYLTKEDQIRVFERFYRVDDSRSRETGGSGLGLAIAKEIMDSLHGTISMDSTDTTTTCTITLPAY